MRFFRIGSKAENGYSTCDAERTETLLEGCVTELVNDIIRFSDEEGGKRTETAVFSFLGDAEKWGGTVYYMLQTSAGNVSPVAEKPEKDGVIENGDIGGRNGRDGESGNVTTVNGANSAEDDVMGVIDRGPRRYGRILMGRWRPLTTKEGKRKAVHRTNGARQEGYENFGNTVGSFEEEEESAVGNSEEEGADEEVTLQMSDVSSIR